MQINSPHQLVRCKRPVSTRPATSLTKAVLFPQGLGHAMTYDLVICITWYHISSRYVYAYLLQSGASRRRNTWPAASGRCRCKDQKDTNPPAKKEKSSTVTDLKLFTDFICGSNGQKLGCYSCQTSSNSCENKRLNPIMLDCRVTEAIPFPLPLGVVEGCI